MQEVRDNQLAYMKEYGLDGLVAMSPENFGYVVGVMVPTQVTVRTRLALHIMAADGRYEAVVVNIEEGLVRSESWLEDEYITSYNEFTQDPIELAAEKMCQLGLAGKKVGIELGYLCLNDWNKLTRAMPDTRFVDAGPLFEEMRKVKMAHELSLLETFGSQAEQVIYTAFNGVRAGDSEVDLNNYIVKGFSEIGGEKLTVLTIASGERSSFLNAGPTDRVLKKGDVIRIDLVGTKQGYYCDVCRTAVVGQPTDEYRQIWGRLNDSHDRIVSQLKPGADTKVIYDDFRAQFIEWGYNPVDFVGHGLGLSLHEEPYIGRYASNILKENMALCVEPIHIETGKFAFHLENEVFITRDGCRVISASGSTRELPVVRE